MRLKSSSNMTAAILLVLILVVVITLLSERHRIRWDLTATKVHTLSEKTLNVLKTIKSPVMIKAFVREGHNEREEAKRLLSAYQYQASDITHELIDPDRNPVITRRYKVRNTNTFILEGYGRTQMVKIADEEHLTNGLIRLTKDESQRIYWMTGHGERPFNGSEPETLSLIQESMSNENFKFAEANLMQTDIPHDASILVIAAPLKPLFPEEVESLRRYLNKGGNVLIFLEPFRDGGLKDFLKDYGIVIAQDIIVDKLSRVMGGDYLLPMVASYGMHEITKGFKVTSFFYMARSVEIVPEKIKGIRLTSLARTSPNSWAETDHQALDKGHASFDVTQDRQGPVSLAVIAELEPPINKMEEEKQGSQKDPLDITGKGRMVVFGDIDFASNKFLNFSGNGDFITNAMNYLGGREDFITISKKHRPIKAVMLTRGQGTAIFWITVVLLPITVLLLGIVVWHKRRSR